jgi:hypothetical protein
MTTPGGASRAAAMSVCVLDDAARKLPDKESKRILSEP